MGTNKKEHGAVSLFIVIFSALLITVVTVGFIRLMVADQQQASANDLSQSAYDSAQAGVEDAKRALLRYQNICLTGDVTACSTAYSQIASSRCNQGLANIVDSSSLAATEVPVIKQSDGTAELSQAYTCVTIIPETDDYLGTLPANGSKIIPIKSKSTVTSVVIEWYDKSNISSSSQNVTLLTELVGSGSTTSISTPLYNQTASGWGANRPSIMRAQLMQFGANFSLSDFDNTNLAGESNANTLFLYPTGTTGNVTNVNNQFLFSARDKRLTALGSPLPVSCNGKLGSGGYACKVQLDLPTPVGGAGAPTIAYLRLSALYNASNYKVTLLQATGAAKFDAVQPEIDSTGRANDLFRRVRTRVELIDTSFAYPEATVDVTGNICKNFVITDKPSEYVNSCTP